MNSCETHRLIVRRVHLPREVILIYTGFVPKKQGALLVFLKFEIVLLHARDMLLFPEYVVHD